MKTVIDRYLDAVLLYANRPPAESGAIREELRDHLLEKIDALAAGGLPREEAVLEALRRHGSPRVVGYGLRPFQWIDIRTHGTARGVIAIGPKAVGVFAFGGLAAGLVAVGGVSAGLISIGGFAIGLLLALGGCSVGSLAFGGLAIGATAIGGMAVGLWIPGAGNPVSYYSAQTAPAFLKSAGFLLGRIFNAVNFYGWIFWPLYAFLICALSALQHRENKRVHGGNAWFYEE